MLETVAVFGGVFAFVGLLLWSATTIRYRIGPRHLKISWLGLPVRRIRLDDIKHISRKRSLWSERWHSTLHPRNRLLVIIRRRGLVKQVSITPKSPYVFKADLERACKGNITHLPEPGPHGAGDRAAA